MEKDPFQNQNNVLPPLTQQEFNSWQPPEGQPFTHSRMDVQALDQLFTVETELPNPLENNSTTSSSISVIKSQDMYSQSTNHVEQPSETLELNIEEGPVDPIAVTGALALGGLGKSVSRMRLRRAERKLEKLESKDRVIKNAAREADELRGFKSSPMDPEDLPIRPIEKLATIHRDNQGTKKRKQHIEQSRLRDVYGESAPPLPSRITQSTSGTAAADRWNEAAEKLEKIDRGSVVSFEPASREGIGQTVSRANARRKHAKAGRKADRIDSRLDKGVHGESVPGQIRQNRIDRQQRKIDKLRNKI